jgi:hypothetical protein
MGVDPLSVIRLILHAYLGKIDWNSSCNQARVAGPGVYQVQ